MGEVQFRVLGSVDAVHDRQELPLGGRKQRLVVALLVSSPGDLVSADRLVESVWNGTQPTDPRRSLQVYASNLRGALDGVALQYRDDGYVLHVAPEQVDAEQFARLVERGCGLVEDDPAGAATMLRDALGLWRGRPFGALADEPALAGEVARLEELRWRAMEARVDADLALGRHVELTGELAELTQQQPLRERLWGQRILALYRSGRQAEALAAYETARETLAEELGIDPSPQLQGLHTGVLRQDPALDPPTGAASAAGQGAPALRHVRGYELVEEVGSGGVGVVYRARQAAAGRVVAVKAIGAELANDPEFVRRFEAEAQAVARLDHPHVVPLHDWWREPDAAYLVMRWMRGGSLAATLRRGPWGVEAAVPVVEQVAAALDAAHRRGIVHRALKPANVLLDEADNAHLSDFAVARVDKAPTPAGALPYLAPEHVAGEPVTAATDVFALGLVAFELLTGRHPYEGESPHALSQRVRRQPLPDPSVFDVSLPDGVMAALRRATAVAVDERFASAGEFAEALGGSVRGSPGGAGGPQAVRNPYKGLRAFDEADADDFFGRERLVTRLLDRLAAGGRRTRFTAVVGPSGSGKSSLVRAGLVPALRQGGLSGSDRWFVAAMLPGQRPMAELERALLEVATCDGETVSEALHGDEGGLVRATERLLPDDRARLLLVIDQFEELFVLATAEQRRRFASQLRHAANATGRLCVVATLRADFYDHPLLDHTLGELVAAGTVAVSTLSDEELERAVAAPARAAGLDVPADLVTQIAADVGRAPGDLPLLQYALTELVERRDDGALTLDRYREIGGVHGALAGRADELYAALDPAAQEVCRQVFLRLVTVGETSTDTRRRVTRDELAGLAEGDTIEHVLELFGRHRLLTFDRDPVSRAPTVEIAHEALLDRWSRLRDWIDAVRGDLVMHRRLAVAVAEWQAAGRDEGYLLAGPRLAEFDGWAARSEVALTPDEQRLLADSRAVEAARQADERARQERERQLERRSVNRLRAVAAVLGIAAVTAAGLSVFAFRQRDAAQRQQALAQQQERVATARGLAAAATAELDTDPERSILLARQAVRTTRAADGEVLPQAESALRDALQASRLRGRLPAGGGLGAAGDGRVAMLASDGTLTVWGADVWDAEWDAPRLERDGHSSTPLRLDPDEPATRLHQQDDVDLAADGSRLVVADDELRGAVRDTDTGEVETRLDGQLARPRFSPDGKLVAAILPQPPEDGDDAARTVGIWDADTGELIQRLDGHVANVSDYAFTPDGSELVTVTRLDGARLWSVADGQTRWRLSSEPEDHPTFTTAVHPDGNRVVFGSRSGAVLVHDIGTGDRLETLDAHSSPVLTARFSRDGQRLVTTTSETARVWDVDQRRSVFVLRGHRQAPTDAAFSPDGERLMTASEAETRIWDISVDGGFEHAALSYQAPLPATPHTSFVPGEPRLATSRPGGAVHTVNLDTLERQPVLPAQNRPVHAIAYSNDGSTIATSSIRGADGASEEWRYQVDVWDAASGEHRRQVTTSDAVLWDLALTANGSRVLTAAADGEIRAVDVATGDQVFTYQQEGGQASRLASTPDGDRLVAGVFDAGLVLDADTGEVLDELDDTPNSIWDVAFVDETRMVAGEVGGAVRLWDADTTEQLDVVSGDEPEVRSVAAHDGLVAYSGVDHLTVRDVDRDERRFTVDYPDTPLQLRFSDDGRYLAAVFAGGVVRTHVMDPDRLLELADQRVTRELTDEECDQFLNGPCPERG